MNKLIWLLKWALKAAVFFTLFAFALNNQQDTTVYFFFGTTWKTSMVIIVLVTFTLGVVVGVLGMVPRWWRHRRAVKKITKDMAASGTASNATSTQVAPDAQGAQNAPKQPTVTVPAADYVPHTL